MAINLPLTHWRPVLHRKILGIPIIGITGTNGKTTTKELIAAVLSTKYNTLYTEGNLNNQIGVPLTLLRLDNDHEMAVIEMGANHPGDIKELVEIVAPNYGIITNIGCAHLEGFGSLEGVIQTKGELYDYLRHTKGKIFIQHENKILQQIAKGLEQISYGQEEGDFTVGHVVSCNPFLTFDWKQQGKVHVVDTHLIGAYNLDNILAAIAVGRYFKIPAERISRSIATYEPTNNRSQWKETEKNHLIIDAYNANPSSMKLALENFAQMDVTPKAVILGDMRELGPTSDELHQEVAHQLQRSGFDQVLLCGEHFSRTGDFPNNSSLERLPASASAQRFSYFAEGIAQHGLGNLNRHAVKVLTRKNYHICLTFVTNNSPSVTNSSQM